MYQGKKMTSLVTVAGQPDNGQPLIPRFENDMDTT